MPDFTSDVALGSTVFDLFPTVRPDAPEAGFIYDSLGARNRTAFVGGDPARPAMIKAAQHGSWEWIPLLWSAATAQDSYRMVELGAGFGPWMIRSHKAARMRGLSDIHIFGVEAEFNHFGYLTRNIADNAIPAAEHTLVQALSAGQSGVALFPLTETPEKSWGLRRVGRTGTDADAILAEVGARPSNHTPGSWRLPKSPHEYRIERSISLADLIGDTARVDFMHVDIQGSEAEVAETSIALLNDRFRCLAIGTHSHEIEDRLRALFGANGWTCHHDTLMHRDARDMLRDGHQVWTNDRFGRVTPQTL